MATQRTTISMPEELYAQAKARQKEFNYSTFSVYIQNLVHMDITSKPETHVRESAPEYKTSSRNHTKPPPRG